MKLCHACHTAPVIGRQRYCPACLRQRELEQERTYRQRRAWRHPRAGRVAVLQPGTATVDYYSRYDYELYQYDFPAGTLVGEAAERAGKL
jgi:hypothetical protein